MVSMGEAKTYTYRTAAKRVNRSDRTIRHWREWGMPMGWAIIEGQRTRVVTEEVLLAHWRLHMKQNPVHQLRMRARQRGSSKRALGQL